MWTYEGPPHVGAMRVAASMKNLHYVLHAPQGDTYADLLFTMIERRNTRPPVTYTTFEARDLGADTADLFCETIEKAYERFTPQAMIVGASCTAELLQDDPGGLAKSLDLPVPVIPLELPSYQKKETWGASETFYQIVRALARTPEESRIAAPEGRPSCNILGPTSLGFRSRDDVIEITRLVESLGVRINVVAPLGATPADIVRLPDADANIVLCPEVAETSARWLERRFGQPYTKTIPYGVAATREFIEELSTLLGLERAASDIPQGNFAWWSKSVDSTYLTNKRVFLFGEGRRVATAARVAQDEFGFEVVGVGCYNREYARDIRALAETLGVDATISDDYLDVEAAINAAQPELVLGTQMERHIAKRMGVPCAVISAPFHVQDHPARYSPQLGFEGANVLFDAWVHPLVMGLEEHLLHMFRDDFEFHDDAGPSHLGGAAVRQPAAQASSVQDARTLARETPGSKPIEDADAPPAWTEAAVSELKKIPFFVRGKARRNTERFAQDRSLPTITIETLYEAKSHYGR